MSINYQLKIELVGSHPTIWRRLVIPGNTPFDNLHDMIQISMGWHNEYPFQFIINQTTVRDFGPEVDTGENPNDRDAMDSELAELITTVHTSFKYMYGFDDPWEHQITLEKILRSEDGAEQAVCIGGEGVCPPDDCSGTANDQKMPDVRGDKTLTGNSTKRQLAGLGSVSRFNMKEINARLRRYSEEWDEIYDEAGEILDGLEGEHDDAEFDDPEYLDSEYESLRHLRYPSDLLHDELENPKMEFWINHALTQKDSVESNTFSRLMKEGHDEKKSRSMILDALSIEWFSDLKYGTNHLDDRYQRNLQQLPKKPVEILSLDYALQILDNCTKGIPFAAIEYLHNDRSHESTSAIIKALHNFSDHQYCWGDCASTPIWYSLAAEGHLCEELIDPVIGFYSNNNPHATDWIHDQGQYLIGKLAQKYPDITGQKVLAAMEKDAEVHSGHDVYYLFDVFDFCNIDKYKGRLIALLKRSDIYWHDMLASTVAHLQIKEGLPVLKEQLTLLKSKQNSPTNWNPIEIEEAIRRLEMGQELYPDAETPLCLTRTTTWKEEFADAEKYFYDSGAHQGRRFRPGDAG